MPRENIIKIMRVVVVSAIANFSTVSHASEAITSAEAMAVAQTAIAACAKAGYHVSVTVVDASGLVRTSVRGDGATPHTLDSAHAKAYTAATFAPIVNLLKTSEIASRVLASPETAQLAHLPGVLLMSGGVALTKNQEIVGGIGVGGAPGGPLDEACATAGAQALGDNTK